MSADSGIIFGDPTTGLGLGNPDTDPQLGLGIPFSRVTQRALCPNKIDCPGTDFPVTNYTSENIPPFVVPQGRGFTKDGYCCDGSYRTYTSFISEDDAVDGLNRLLFQCDPCPPKEPKNNFNYTCTAECQNGGGTVVGASNLSQEDACNRARAMAEAETCPPVPNITEFCNSQQSCPVMCPDGTTFTFVVPPCAVLGPTQQQADYIAFNLACSRAQRNKLCLGDLPLVTCLGSSYLGVLSPTVGGNPPISFSVSSGSLPDGLMLSSGSPDSHSATVSGTTTVAGSFTFFIEAIDANGNTMVKSFTICVIDQTVTPAGSDSSHLPNGTAGSAYSAKLQAPDCAATPLSWQLKVPGSLPTGLTLDESTGNITGTIDPAEDPGDYLITVILQTEAT